MLLLLSKFIWPKRQLKITFDVGRKSYVTPSVQFFSVFFNGKTHKTSRTRQNIKILFNSYDYFLNLVVTNNLTFYYYY